MITLYQRLSAVGLTRRFVRETALPSWWEDEIAANAAGYAQGLLSPPGFSCRAGRSRFL